MTTNGVTLKRWAKALKENGLNRLNISLDTLDPEKYKKITRIGDISNCLEGIKEAKKVGFENIKINTVLLSLVRARYRDPHTPYPCWLSALAGQYLYSTIVSSRPVFSS